MRGVPCLRVPGDPLIRDALSPPPIAPDHHVRAHLAGRVGEPAQGRVELDAVGRAATGRMHHDPVRRLSARPAVVWSQRDDPRLTAHPFGTMGDRATTQASPAPSWYSRTRGSPLMGATRRIRPPPIAVSFFSASTTSPAA